MPSNQLGYVQCHPTVSFICTCDLYHPGKLLNSMLMMLLGVISNTCISSSTIIMPYFDYAIQPAYQLSSVGCFLHLLKVVWI